MEWLVVWFWLSYVRGSCWMKSPESPLRCGDGTRARKSTDSAISYGFSLCLPPSSYLEHERDARGEEEGNMLCREESQEITKNPDPNILSHGSKIMCFQTAHCQRKIEPVIFLRLCFWGLCSALPNVTPRPQTRQHFISIINLRNSVSGICLY